MRLFPYGLTDMAGLTIQHVVRTKQEFVRKLRILKRNNFWNVSKWLGGAYKSSTSHVDQQQTPVLIRDDKIKWLDFGTNPDPENPQPHPGFVWVKSGYSETIAIAWCKVQLTKQRNVDLTTDGLWAMPLNGVGASQGTQAAGLGKTEKICSNSQAGGCVPQWGPCPCGILAMRSSLCLCVCFHVLLPNCLTPADTCQKNVCHLPTPAKNFCDTCRHLPWQVLVPSMPPPVKIT